MYSVLALWDSISWVLVNLLGLLNMIWPYLLMALGFSAIVFVHELGHFAVAKWAGVRVERFAIGFGREIFGFTKGETRYSFNVLPLGGYVKMLGQEDFDDKTNELKFKDDPRSFVNKPVLHRMAIVSAGVIMNILFAFLLFGIVFMIGKEAPATRIGAVEPDSPAHKAGLLPGDDVISINGERVREFGDVRSAVFLAPPHEPIEFVVRRQGNEIETIKVVPDYRRPDVTKDMRRQMVGITPGRTSEIAAVFPEIDTSKPDQPHPGDMLVRIGGTQISNANANEIIELLPYIGGQVIVERRDSEDPSKSPVEVEVQIPPRMKLFPAERGDASSATLLGLTPLVKFDGVEPGSRGDLAGLRSGDTVLSWDDIPFPNRSDMLRAVRENAERDIHFRVKRADGRVVSHFVRPKVNARGNANIQATCVAIDAQPAEQTGAQAHFVHVRPGGVAALAGIESGDVVLAIDKIENPTATSVNSIIQDRGDSVVMLRVRHANERTITTSVVPRAPGSIDSSFETFAEDSLQIGKVVAEIQDQPTPAALAGVPDGARIKSVDGVEMNHWRDLIAAFRKSAGGTMELAFVTREGETKTVSLAVAHTLHTLLGIGPEARILKIDGKESIVISRNGDEEEVLISHPEGLRTALSRLVGQKQVPIEYRDNVLSPLKTAHVDISAEVVDPWLARVTFSPTVLVNLEMITLKGRNVIDAIGIGVHKTYYFVRQVLEYLNRMIVSRTVSVESAAGPLGIFDMGGKVARSSGVDFLFFLAMISANLAVINFLPLPIVDGGLMVFLLIEGLKGSPVSIKVQVATQAIGLFLIAGAFFFVTYNDVMRLFG